MRVGDFYSVNLHDLEKAFGTTQLTDMSKHAKISAAFDRNGIWEKDSHSNRLVRRKNPGRDTIGDIRVSYRVLNQFS